MINERVVINDVGPRDGLQNQAKVLNPQQRLQLIAALVGAGLPAIEVGAFVSPKAVPAMAGTDQVVAALSKLGTHYSTLIPNRKGYELAKASGINTVSLVVAASNTMNEKNIRMTTEQAMTICDEVIAQSIVDGLETMVYIATAWECPFEGTVPETTVIELAHHLLAAGASKVIVADTIGAANPATVNSLMSKLVEAFGAEKLCCHFHDTRGMALANVWAALQTGIRQFDTSIGGLGGCPFAPGAAGNVATEDVALMLQQMGYDTGIDLNKLLDAVELAAQLTENCEGGHAFRWLKVQRAKGEL